MGTPAPGNGGTNEGAATQKPTERHKGAATQKPTSEKRNSRSNLGRGEGTREPWRRGATDFCKLSRQLLVGLNEHRWRRTMSTASSTSRCVTPPHDAHRSVGLGRFFSHHPPTQANFIISLHMMKLKNNVSVRDFEHFGNEIDLAGLKSFVPTFGGRLRQASEDRLVLPVGHGVHFPVLGAEHSVLTHFKPQVDRFVFPDGHLVIVLGSGRLRILG